MQNLQKPAHGVHISQHLDHGRHVVNGKNKPAEQHRRHQYQESGEQGLLLGVGRDADEQGQPQVADQKEHGHGIEQQQAAVDPQAEDGQRHDEHVGHGDQPGNQKRQGLAGDEFRPPDGGHHHLFDGADLLLPHDGDAGQQEADHHQHHGDQTRNIVELALEIGVVPGTHLQGHRQGDGLPLPVEGIEHLVCVVEDDGRIVVVGSVGDDLDLGAPAGVQVAFEAHGDMDHRLHPGTVQHRCDVFGRVQRLADLEPAAAFKGGREHPAGRRVIFVQDGGADILDVGGQGKG